MVSITRHTSMNILQMEHFSAVKLAMGLRKNVSILVIPKSQKFEKIVEKSNWAPLITYLLTGIKHIRLFIVFFFKFFFNIPKPHPRIVPGLHSLTNDQISSQDRSCFYHSKLTFSILPQKLFFSQLFQLN